MKIGNWTYKVQNPVYFFGQHNEFYPYLTVVLRSPVTRDWSGKPGEPPF